jgi:hypothetical protein
MITLGGLVTPHKGSSSWRAKRLARLNVINAFHERYRKIPTDYPAMRHRGLGVVHLKFLGE